MHSTKKRAVLAALVVSGLMLVGTACGGSSSKSSDSASSSGSSSETTAKSSGGGSGGDSGKCAELLKKSEALAAKMEATGSSAADSGDMSAGMSSMIKDLESFTSTVPSDIRGDWKTIVDAFKEYASALEGVNMNNLTDPATMEKLTKAGAALDSAKVQKASDNLDAWTKKNCPSLAAE